MADLPAQTFLTDLFDLLSPRGISKLAGGDGAKTQSLNDKLRIKLIDKTTRMSDIEKLLSAEATAKKQPDSPPTPEGLADIKKDFHCVTKSKGIFSMIGDEDYWRKGTKISPTSSLSFQDSDWLIAKDNNLSSKKCEIGIVVSKDPYLSPAVAKTEDVEMFLNYTPPLVANQLVPYLEIEMIGQKKITLSLKASDSNTDDKRREELGKQGLYYLSTPSLLRFLVGSVDRSTATAADQAISRFGDITLTQQGDQFTGASIEAKSGMELFLSPQSLSNISTTKASTDSKTGLPNGRLVDAKPFLPFASILDFEVKILNAGAGAMAHKTGKLQLKIHDKSRISEMSEFFRGPSGYGFVKIWTSYGWIAPSRISKGSDGKSSISFNNEDAYADFINESMHAEDCWQIKNTQFGFDQVGTVNLTLDLVGLGVSKSKRTSIKLGGQYEAMIAGYENLLQELSDLSNKYGASVLGPDARLSQILNAGASGQMLPSSIKENPSTYIAQVVNHYADTGAINAADAEKIKSQLSLVLDPAATKAALSGVRATEITNLITRCTEGADPFLASPLELPPPPPDPKKKQAPVSAPKRGAPPTEPVTVVNVNKGDDATYFSADLRGALQKFQAGNTLATKKDKGGKQEATSTSDNTAPTRIAIDAGKNKIVSFGKLFINTVLPAFIEANPEIDNAGSEVQVIFYALNDQCGPVSGASIAEFPIDLTRFVYAIDDLMKSKNKNDFTIEEFMRMIVNNQFSDDRSPGYGMIELFEPFNKDNPSPQSASETREGYELALARWQTKYPGFRKPLIEFMIETSPTPLPSSSVRRIDDLINNVAEPSTAGQIVRIHIYDKQVNPRKIFSEFVELSDGFHVGSFNASEVREKLKANETNRTEVQKFLNDLNGAGAADLAASIGNDGTLSGIAAGQNPQPAVLNNLIKLKTPEGTSQTVIKRNPAALRDSLRALAPTILIGSQGTLVKTATLASKTDDLMAAANLVNIMKPKAGNANSVAPPSDGLSGPGGLPVRTVPASLNIVTMGCPAARLYQQYFVDLGTGTSLDNLYNCTEVTHKLTPGKFETTLNFAFTDGYGKFSGAPSIIKLLKDASKSPPEPSQDDKKTNKSAPAAKPKTTPQAKAGKEDSEKKKEETAAAALNSSSTKTITTTIK